MNALALAVGSPCPVICQDIKVDLDRAMHGYEHIEVIWRCLIYILKVYISMPSISSAS